MLVTNLGETEWPDRLNPETGEFIYYGDNRSPGKAIGATPAGGNRLLEKVFNQVHHGERATVPPFVCFESFKGADGMYMRFLGLAAPGGPNVSGLQDLVAVWRIKDNERFQNYRALFSVLAAETVTHDWLEDLVAGVPAADSKHCPLTWRRWVTNGTYKLLQCERTIRVRAREEQQPQARGEERVLDSIFESLNSREFEFATASIVNMMDDKFMNLEVTRAVRDGGRDVVGKYRVGHDLHQLLLSVSIEAKQWKKAIGVREVMRLLSRIKHRDMGVFVTTSYFDRQVQKELIEDGHPVIMVSGGDIARLLIAEGIEGQALKRWIERVKTESVSADDKL